MDRLLLPLAAVLAGCFLVAPTTLASDVIVRDPQGDAKGTLDIASVRGGDGARLVTHRLTAYRPWRDALLANGGRISFSFDTDGDRAPERRLDVGYARGRLSAVVTNSGGRRIGTGLVARPSRGTVVVSFDRSLLRPGIRRYRWFAFAAPRCRHRNPACGDRAPNGRTLVTSRLAPAAPPPPAVPAPIRGHGYSLAFADNFDRLDRASWTNRAFWDGPPPRDAVHARDGLLHLVSRRSQGYKNITVSSHGKRNFRQGYFEARMRWTKGPGAWPAFWLSSTHHYTTHRCPYLNSELDVFEGVGSEPSRFYGTLHRNTSAVCGARDETRPPFGWRDVGDMTTGFHVYSALWTKAEVIWYFDGREVVRAPAFDSTDQTMYMIFDMWIGGWAGGTTSATPPELRTEVDWVRVWRE